MEALAGLFFVLLVIALGAAFYFLPAIVACNREHHDSLPIFILNPFLGWTFPGWAAALIWSFMQVREQ